MDEEEWMPLLMLFVVSGYLIGTLLFLPNGLADGNGHLIIGQPQLSIVSLTLLVISGGAIVWMMSRCFETAVGRRFWQLTERRCFPLKGDYLLMPYKGSDTVFLVTCNGSF